MGATGLQGIQGIQGIQGEKGDTGSTGLQAYLKDTSSTAVNITLANDTVYEFSTALLSLTLTKTQPTDAFYHLFGVNFKSGSTATTFTAPNYETYGWYFYGDSCASGVFIPTANTNYELTGAWILDKFRWFVKAW